MQPEPRWEERLPPKDTGRRSRSTEPMRLTVQALSDRPGCWAVVATTTTTQQAASLAARLRLGAFGPGIEAAARSVGGECRVYARFVGEVPQ